MRHIILTYFALIILSFANAQTGIPGTLSIETIKSQQSLFSANKIKTSLCYEYIDEPFDPETAPLYERTEYDDAGRKVRSTEYSTDSIVTMFKYNEDGRLVYLSAGYDPEFPDVHNYYYDNNGKLTEKTIAAGESRKYTFSHNKSGLIVQQKGQGNFPDNNGNLKWTDCENYTYTYDNSNRLTEVIWMYEPGYGIPRKMIFTYNDNNMLFASTLYRIGDSEKEWLLECTSKFEYDEKGFLVLVTKDYGNSDIIKLAYRYLSE